jgi:membrane dipeptidase
MTTKEHDRSKSGAQGGDLSESILARDLVASSDVWEMTLPWIPTFWDIDILRRYRSAGFTFVSATIQDWPATFDGTVRSVERFKQLAASQSQWLAFGSCVAEIEQGRRDGKLVIGLNSQDPGPIERDLSRVEAFHRLGMRHMLLAYNTRNLIADGCAEAADAGLSNFGRLFVREMDRVGIVVDGAHTGRRSSLEAMELSGRPPIFSHSGAYSVCAHIRNIHDDQIRACAARGGVIGVVGTGAFLGDVEARTESLFRHIDYVSTLVGPQHVGLGTDFVKDLPRVWESIRRQKDTAWPDPTGTQLYEGSCFQPEQLLELVAMLLSRGYATDEVKGILGENFKRVYATVEAALGD